MDEKGRNLGDWQTHDKSTFLIIVNSKRWPSWRRLLHKLEPSPEGFKKWIFLLTTYFPYITIKRGSGTHNKKRHRNLFEKRADRGGYP